MRTVLLLKFSIKSDIIQKLESQFQLKPTRMSVGTQSRAALVVVKTLILVKRQLGKLEEFLVDEISHILRQGWD